MTVQVMIKSLDTQDREWGGGGYTADKLDIHAIQRRKVPPHHILVDILPLLYRYTATHQQFDFSLTWLNSSGVQFGRHW